MEKWSIEDYNNHIKRIKEQRFAYEQQLKEMSESEIASLLKNANGRQIVLWLQFQGIQLQGLFKRHSNL